MGRHKQHANWCRTAISLQFWLGWRLALAQALLQLYRMAPEERARLGINDQLIRLSVGIEDVADLVADLDRALDTQS